MIEEEKKEYEDMKTEYDKALSQTEILNKMLENELRKEKENDDNIFDILE